MENKKIIIAAEIWPPDIGGPATYAYKLANELTDRGLELEVITYADKAGVEQVKAKSGRQYNLTKIYRKVPPVIKYLNYLFKLLRLAKKTDVIYAQGPLGAGWPAMWVKRLRKTKLVIKVVGDQAWERAYQTGKTDKLLDDFLKEKHRGKIQSIHKIQVRALKAADGIISVSNYFKNIFEQWGIETNKVVVIHNSVETAPAADTSGVDIEGDIILSVGRLTAWKGMDTLIELMPELLEENKNFKLVIIGSGPEEERLKELVADMKLEDKVVLTGKLERKKLAAYYQKAEMLILNSGYDNWSHILLEAMANGLPVIASNIGGNPELVEDGKTGLIVDYNDKTQIKTAIFRLWLNEHLALQFSANARKKVEGYTFDDLCRKTLEVLAENKTAP